MSLLKKIAHLGFFALLFLNLTHFAHAEGDRSIKVTSPNGGETLQVGQTYTIRWEASSNIDKVSIGWSTGPGSLNWIAFTAPNTGSYTWTVNVGNTTNTQFKIDITGYETGQGSTSDQSDGFFTVLGGSSSNSNSNSNTKSSSSPSSANNTSTSTRSSPLPTTRPSPSPVALSIANITLWNVFIFDGSETTKLSDIKDPKHVENFTLDTKDGFTFVFQEEIDLTNQNTLSAIKNIQDYWIIETWYIFIKIEWWETYEIKTPIEIKYENAELTTFSPTVTQETVKTTSIKNASPIPSATPSILKTKESTQGLVRFDLTTGGKINISPRVELDGKPNLKVTDKSVTLKGHSSHKNLIYKAKINGTLKDVTLTYFDEKTGEFKFVVNDLVEGANFLELSAGEKPDTLKVVDEITITYNKSFWSQYKNVLFTLFFILAMLIIGLLIKKNLKKIKTLKKNVTQKETKLDHKTKEEEK